MSSQNPHAVLQRFFPNLKQRQGFPHVIGIYLVPGFERCPPADHFLQIQISLLPGLLYDSVYAFSLCLAGRQKVFVALRKVHDFLPLVPLILNPRILNIHM